MSKPPRQPSQEDFAQANYLIKTSGLQAERQERLRIQEAEKQERLRIQEAERKKKQAERRKIKFFESMVKEPSFKPLSRQAIERKNAEKAEEEEDKRLGIVRAPAVIPRLEDLSRGVVQRNFDYTNLPKDDPQRIIIEGRQFTAGKSRRHKKSRKSKKTKRSRRNKKTKRSKSRR
jgi:hypothetical protein